MVTSRSELLPRTVAGYHSQGLYWYLLAPKGRLFGSESQPVVKRASKGHAGTRHILIRVTYAVTQDHSAIRDRAAVEVHVWVCGTTAVRVDVYGSCCHQGSCQRPGSGQSPFTMSVFEDHVIPGAILGGQCCHVKPRRCPGTDCCLGSYLCLWPCRGQGLGWCLWFQLSPRALWIPGV